MVHPFDGAHEQVAFVADMREFVVVAWGPRRKRVAEAALVR